MEFKRLSFDNFNEIIHFMPKKLPPEEFLSEFSPIATVLWAKFLSTEFAILEKTLILRTNYHGFGAQYKFPLGENVDNALDEIFEIEKNPSFFGLNKTQSEKIVKKSPDYCINPIRDFFDYVYDGEKIKTLSGKKLQQKRNHYNAFVNLYPEAKYTIIDEQIAEKCAEIYPSWMVDHPQKDDEGFIAEAKSLIHILNNWKKFSLLGGAIEYKGKIIAFTISEQINENLAIIHFEKANRDFRGSYAAINKWHAQNTHSDTQYINREDDGGVRGLRQTKLAYRPIFMVEKFRVTNKIALRKFILGRRKGLEPLSLTDEIDITNYNNIYIYKTLPSEINTSEFIKNNPNKRFFIPEMNAYNMTFTPLDNGPHAEPDLIIVPALAYSKDGHRLGFGKGCYDKFLKNHINTPKIGIIQEEFFLENLPIEPHDIKVDKVVVIKVKEIENEQNEID